MTAEIPRNEAADVVTGDRQAIPKARDAAAGGVEVGRRLGLDAAHLVMKSVPTTNTANMLIAVQLVACFSAWPRSAPAANAAPAAASTPATTAAGASERAHMAALI
jgi:hypothetical protein